MVAALPRQVFPYAAESRTGIYKDVAMLSAIQPRYVPPPCQDATDSGRLILRDGSTASIRVARPEDQPELLAFFKRLSPESRQRRFFSVSMPSAELVASLCDSTDPRSTMTLIVTRIYEGKSRIIATGSYLARDERTAEVAFAVEDAFQGKGLGTLLLERLSLLAVRHGFTRFWAVTHADNLRMRDVFRESGFEVRERMEGTELEVDLSVIPTEKSVARLEMHDRVATTASIRPFFRPQSVAVVGASRDPGSIGYRLLANLVQCHFHGAIYPVNPRADFLLGLKAYPSARDLPAPVDLAIVAVPRDAVLGVVDDCAARGVRALVVISAGFAEVGSEGRELQQQLAEKVRGHGMRMIGPNCMGLLNTDPSVRLNATFAPVYPPPGRVAMSSQSGALGLAVLAAACRFDLGLSTFVSVGNKADVSGNDLLQYWEEDDNTDVILLYLESFGNPRRFARIARRVCQRKPIVAIKSGRTRAGGRAAGSHTAALAANDVAVDALFRQTGVIRAETLEEMFDLAATLGSQPLPKGRRVAIVTNAGGPGILCADACEAGGLVIPELSAALRTELSSYLPAAASVANPVDMIASASADHYRHVVQTILASGEVDAVIAIYIPVGLAETKAVMDAVREAVAAARQKGLPEQPVLTCLMDERAKGPAPTLVLPHKGGGDSAQPSAPCPPAAAHRSRLPSYEFPEAAARVLSKAATYAEWRAQPPGVIPDFVDVDPAAARKVCRQALTEQGEGWLSVTQTRLVLAAMRLPLLPGDLAASSEEAVEVARRVGYPVALKLASRTLIHKTEVGGVHLHLNNADAVIQAFQKIRDRLAQKNLLDAMEGVLVQPMIAGGVEVMVGVTQDRLFGPLIAFGLGGIYVEVLADVCFRITPLTDRDAAEMVRGIRGFRLLQGYRGHPPADVPAIEELLLRVSQLVEDVPEICELDLNPFFALPPGQGCRIADARIRVAKG